MTNKSLPTRWSHYIRHERDAAANTLALEFNCYWKPEAPCVGYTHANTVCAFHLTERSQHDGRNLSSETGLATPVAITIRPNSIRRLKTKGSKRTIPVSQSALELLQEHRLGKDDQARLFSDYARSRGNDAASAMLMKRLRQTISDPKVTIHSRRHRMKDKLRNTGCQEAVSMAILGHGTNTVAANYGSGYAIEVMREHMEKAWD